MVCHTVPPAWMIYPAQKKAGDLFELKNQANKHLLNGNIDHKTPLGFN
jgi:hypothetical protein